MQWKVVELTVDVELTHLHSITRVAIRFLRTCECGRKVQIVQTVHLRDVRHRNTATRVERSLLRSRSIFLGDMHGSRRHISNNVTVPLILRFAWRVYVHLEMPNASVIGKRDFRVTPAHAWKPIDLVACKFISPTGYALSLIH